LFLNEFYHAEAPEKEKKHSPVKKLLPELPAQSALSSALIVKNEFKISDLFGLGQDLTIIVF
jgi:hypothetical protein